MPLTASLSVAVAATQTNTLDMGGTSESRVSKAYTTSLSNGVGAGQADLTYHKTRTLAASANEDLDLAGVLASAFGSTLAYVRIKTLVIAALTANTHNVVIGGAPANAWVGPFGAATHTLAARPGETKVLVGCGAADPTAYGVTAATGDLLRITNGGAVTPVTYDIFVIGTSS